MMIVGWKGLSTYTGLSINTLKHHENHPSSKSQLPRGERIGARAIVWDERVVDEWLLVRDSRPGKRVVQES